METVITISRIAATAVLFMLAAGFIMAFGLMLSGSVMYARKLWRSRKAAWTKDKKEEALLTVGFFAFAMVSAAAAALMSVFATMMWR